MSELGGATDGSGWLAVEEDDTAVTDDRLDSAADVGCGAVADEAADDVMEDGSLTEADGVSDDRADTGAPTDGEAASDVVDEGCGTATEDCATCENADEAGGCIEGDRATETATDERWAKDADVAGKELAVTGCTSDDDAAENDARVEEGCSTDDTVSDGEAAEACTTESEDAGEEDETTAGGCATDTAALVCGCSEADAVAVSDLVAGWELAWSTEELPCPANTLLADGNTTDGDGALGSPPPREDLTKIVCSGGRLVTTDWLAEADASVLRRDDVTCGGAELPVAAILLATTTEPPRDGAGELESTGAALILPSGTTTGDADTLLDAEPG